MPIKITKKTGDLLTANEFNQVVEAINTNETNILGAKEDARKASESSTTALNTAKAAKQSAEETAGKLTQVVEEARQAGSTAASAKGDEIKQELEEQLRHVDETLESVDQAVKDAEDATREAVKGTIVRGSCTTNEEGTEATLDLLNKEGEKVVSVKIPAGNSKGGNTINITELVPLQNGFYTLATAIKVVPEKQRQKGICITYEVKNGEWETKQFVGTSLTAWEQEASWEDFGGAGTVKSVTVNGENLNPDASGNVNITFNETEVDESLDPESTNPVQNAAIAAKIAEVEAGTIFGANAELSDDETTVRLSLTNKSGAEVVAVDLPAGSGGGGSGEGGNTTKVVLNASVDNSIIKEGGSSMLTYFFDHQYASGDEKGESTGQKATITISMLRGATTIYTNTINNVARGTYTLDLSKYLFVGATDIYVKATTTDPETGKNQSKQAYVNVKVVTLSLTSAYNLANSINGGGYSVNNSVSIPYAVSGSGTKVVSIYLDGDLFNSATVSKSGTTNGSFTVPMSGLSFGRHTIQMVAEMEASPELTLRSESIYFDIFKAGGSDPLIGTMMKFADGRIFGSSHLTPSLEVGQYEQVQFDFVVYDPGTTPANLSVYRNGLQTQSQSVSRSVQTYTNRFTEQGRNELMFKCGRTEYPFNINVVKSSIDIAETTYGLQMKLTADGRSNSEANPAEWSYNSIKTTFNDRFDWSSNGWTGKSLKLTNGAAIEIGCKPFSTDAGASGKTIEVEFTCTNVTDRSGVVMSCMDNGLGFKITTQEAAMLTGSSKPVYDEDGEYLFDKPIGVSREFAPDTQLKVAFMIGKRNGNRLMELYVNGVRCATDQYGSAESFLQENPAGITISSESADVEVRSVYVYDRAISDDEELANFIVSRESSDEMVALFVNNEVMDDEGLDVDIEKLRAMGKSVMRIVGNVPLVNSTNNKKFEQPVDVYFYSAYGKEYDFVLYNCGLRIQGTSSTKYPRKNYRLYFYRFAEYGTELYVNGVKVEDLTYSFKPGAKPVSIFCLKADYSDSTSTHNTGIARLLNDTWKMCGFLTPPQEKDDSVRTAIDGFPIDLFYSEETDGANTYLGKYNFNNDKSESGFVFGFENIEGFNDAATLGEKENPCICLEFLDNGAALCNFKTVADVESDLNANFDTALEFRFPEGVKWKDASTSHKNAILRLFRWFEKVKNDPATFYREVKDYFNVDSLTAWYIYTEYFMAVDQRAKNMMLATWDLVHWYFLPYDSDTVLGDRNDCFLAYAYYITRDTWDSERNKYAYEGHDSVLWNLVLETMQSELSATAQAIRSHLSDEDVLRMFNETFMGNWSERIYNKDGEYKYIKPATEGVDVKGQKTFYSFLYALKGNGLVQRNYCVKNRFALMDAKYMAGTYRADAMELYLSRKSTDAAQVMTITSSEIYYFGWGRTNGDPIERGLYADAEGDTVDVTFTGTLAMNDPLNVYGASRMREIDATAIAGSILGTLNLNKCTALRRLNLGSASGVSLMEGLNVSACSQLQSLTITNQRGFSTLELNRNTKLQELLAGNTVLTNVTFAEGAPLNRVVLPATLRTLELRYLPNLAENGLTLQGTSNITRFVFESCPQIEWKTLFSKLSNVRYLRVTGINMEGDGSFLNAFMNLGGVDEEGSNVDTCRLVGTYRLTSYMEDSRYEAMCAHFPELNIVQPEYTMIEFDDSVSDDANVSNLDNKTGCKYSNSYSPSAHLTAIFRQRHRVLAKQAEKGVMTICQLHDSNSNYYADSDNVATASPSKLDGTEGDVMMFEPHYWFKGINDYLNKKHYSCYSSNKNKPAVPECDIMTLAQIQAVSENYRAGYKVMNGHETIKDSYTADSNYCVCRVDVSRHKRVRFPTVQGANFECSAFTDSTGKILLTVTASSLSNRFENGMYLIADVPAGAKYLSFTIHKSAEFDMVVLSNSDRIEDMEPDWVEHDECLTGVFGSTIIGDKLRSVISGGSTAASQTWTTFNFYSAQRGMQQIDYSMHRDIANLFFAKYGRRDSQAQCGAGQNTNSRKTGGTAILGMKDTLNTDGKTVGGYDGNGLAFYKTEGDDGQVTFTRINNINCLGYEDIYGHKYDMMDNVNVNVGQVDAKWVITEPDGTQRKVKGATYSGTFIGAVAHGKYMDVIPVGTATASATTGYCDYYYYSGSQSRVVYRGFYFAGSYGGVSSAYAYYDASSSYTYVGSRLAFRGKIVKAQSVSAFKALIEIA